MIYRIAKWQETFETADSRKHKTLSWVSLPVGFASNGYQELIAAFGSEAPMIYGAWCAMLSVAAQAPVRGTLASSRGIAYTPARVAALTMMPVDAFEKLFAWASRPEVGWLVEAQSIDDQSPTSQPSIDNRSPIDSEPASDLPVTALPNLTQPNQTKQDASASLPAEPGDRATAKPVKGDLFEVWWGLVPRKVGKDKARKAYGRAVAAIRGRPPTKGRGGSNPHLFLLDRISAFAKSPKGKSGQFCPHPATWLNEGRYDDDPSEWQRAGDERRGRETVGAGQRYDPSAAAKPPETGWSE